MVTLILLVLTAIIIIIIRFGNTHNKINEQIREEFWEQERASRFVPKKDISGLDYLSIDYSTLPLRFWKPGDTDPIPLFEKKSKNDAPADAFVKEASPSQKDDELSMTMHTVEAMVGLPPAPAAFTQPEKYMAPLSEELSETEHAICALAHSRLLNLTGISNTELRLTYGTANLDPLSACDQNFTSLIRLLQKWGNLLVSTGQKEDAIRVLAYAVSIGSDIAGTYTQLALLYKERGEYDKIQELRASAEQLITLMKPSILRDLDLLLEKTQN